MPWKECSVMDERLQFVARRLAGEAMAELCREFGASLSHKISVAVAKVGELFGAKGDRRDACTREIPGGLLSVDPKTGRILAHLAPHLHFASLISSTDGKELYGIDALTLTRTQRSSTKKLGST
jgi:hypothetical protein